jgi:growth factor-regulated tyrosine kinase substrate
MSFFSSNPFYDMLERATSENIPGAEEDIVLNLDIADLIKSKKIKADEAVNAMKKKLDNSNPNVQLLTIKLLDCCIKNSGNHFLAKVSQKEIVDSMATIIRSSLTNPELKKVALTYFQNWAIAFRTKPDLYYLPSVYNELKREGYRFPAYNSSEVSGALIDTETAPEWSDSSVCMRCRISFTTFNRKHHCRNCGDTFCNDCCNKRIPLPKLGITDSVRVCESCYYKLNNSSYNTPNQSNQGDNSNLNDNNFYGGNNYINIDNYGSSNHNETTSSQEEEDIRRAIELSLKEAENNNTNQNNYISNNNRKKILISEEGPENSDEEEEQMRKAIEESLKDINISDNTSSNNNNNKNSNNNSNFSGVNDNNIISTNPDELLTTEIENIKLFSQLMGKINAEVPIKGFQDLNDPQVQALHVQISSLHPKIMKNKNYYEEKYKKFNDIHEKLVLATHLYDQILSQRLDAARPGGSYSSLLYPSNAAPLQPQTQQQQQQYAYNPYSLPPNSMVPPDQAPAIHDSQPPSTYLNQYLSYSTHPNVPPSTAPPSTINYSQTPVQSQSQSSITGQELPPPPNQLLQQVPQDIPTINKQSIPPYYGIHGMPYMSQQPPYLGMQPNAVPTDAQPLYDMAPPPATIQQAPPPEPVE